MKLPDIKKIKFFYKKPDSWWKKEDLVPFDRFQKPRPWWKNLMIGIRFGFGSKK
jgi:hypothetical protein